MHKPAKISLFLPQTGLPSKVIHQLFNEKIELQILDLNLLGQGLDPSCSRINLDYCTMCKYKVTKKGKLYLTKNCPGGQNIGVLDVREEFCANTMCSSSAWV